MPQFDIKEPRTLRRDLEKYLAERAELNKARESEDLTLGNYDTAVAALETEYSDKIHVEDRYLFSDETEFQSFLDHLKSLNPDNAEQWSWTLQHEREHYEVARRNPNVRAQYCFWAIKEDDGQVSGQPAIYIELTEGTGDDYLATRREAIDAATELSLGDRLEVEE